MAEIINTVKPRRNIYGKDMSSQNCVRAYRSSPETVTLQIRRETEYVSVELNFSQALELAETLKAAVHKYD